jgi:hypothetical protein
MVVAHASAVGGGWTLYEPPGYLDALRELDADLAFIVEHENMLIRGR